MRSVPAARAHAAVLVGAADRCSLSIALCFFLMRCAASSSFSRSPWGSMSAGRGGGSSGTGQARAHLKQKQRRGERAATLCRMCCVIPAAQQDHNAFAPELRAGSSCGASCCPGVALQAWVAGIDVRLSEHTHAMPHADCCTGRSANEQLQRGRRRRSRCLKSEPICTAKLYVGSVRSEASRYTTPAKSSIAHQGTTCQ